MTTMLFYPLEVSRYSLPLIPASMQLITLNIRMERVVLWTLDYLDTLPAELSLFWFGETPMSITTVLFFISRYTLPAYVYIRIWDLTKGPISDSL
jgi:hypothetical protein